MSGSHLPPALAAHLKGRKLEPVVRGESGSDVVHVTGGVRAGAYLKTATSWRRAELRHEHGVLRWLDGRAGAPRVLHFEETHGSTYLLLSEVHGRAAVELASELDATTLVRELARALKKVHALPAADCPFERRVADMVHEAWRRARAGLVDLDDLEPRYRGWSADQLLRELEATAPAQEDLVVVHGDFSLPNIVLRERRSRRGGREAGAASTASPGSFRVSGLVDWGRAGVADRYQDLALLLRSFEGSAGDDLPEVLEQAYGLDRLDAGKIAFYQLLDEFF